VKKLIRVISKFAVGFAGSALIFWGCTNDINDFGKDLLLPGDLIGVWKDSVFTESNIKAFTATDGNQRTDEPRFDLLGTFNDPIFGKTTADFACQFRLTAYPDFSNDAQADSLVLYLLYMENYGDTITPQQLKVYKLASDLSFDGKYYQGLEGVTKGELLADYSYVPKFKLDSLSSTYGSTKEDPKDTVIQEIAIKLNPSLMNYLMEADTLIWSDNVKFLQYFKGLYVEAGDLSQGGSIMKIYTLAAGSRMVLHYHNSEEDSLIYSYTINQSSARVSHYEHDYSTTAFAANLDQEEIQDSLVYLQTTGGLRTKIFIPNLENWRDSGNIAILQAELIFKVDTIISEPRIYLPPEQLQLAAIDAKGESYWPTDYTFSPLYFGGWYNSVDNTYRFNIAKHMQELIKKKTETTYSINNYGFYLETTNKNSSYRRMALKGPTSKTGIRLKITYSKIK